MSSKILGNAQRGQVYIFSAPAGTGKTTLVEMLMEEFPCVKESVSLTTRKQRPNEVDGQHYHFITEEEFEKRIEAGEFLEHAKVFGHYYGTSKILLEEQRKQGFHVILTIDTQGAMQLLGKIDAISIFLLPPSIDELKVRLEGRNTETKEVIEQRISWAEKEMAQAEHYDYNIINDDLTTAYQVMRSILIAEERRVRKNLTE